MPRALELGLNRIFRSRWGVALVLGVIVLAVVGIGRLFAGDTPSSPALDPGSPGPTISADPAEDDSVIDSAPPPSPSTSPGRAQPEAVAYAFASAWVDHEGASAKAWRDRLLPNITKDLADELNGVDPAGVPADRVIGRPSLVPVSATVVNAVVTTDSGKLSLRMIAPDGHWLVDGIDWNSA
ncbi:MAG TPA: hypothetical protein VGB74_09365 [Actinoplanes sp.]|jgi:hypothetical protein